jgi:hypothetical protein
MTRTMTAKIDVGPLERIAVAIDVALHDSEPMRRMEARAYLRAVEPFELVLIAAGQSS